MHRTTLTLIAGTALVLVACGGGSGPMPPTTSGEPESPGSTRDEPPGTRDDPGANCIECDVQYYCPSFSSGQTIDLPSANGMCTQALIDFVCSGALFSATSCTGGGGGSFTCGNVTCSPQQPTQSGGGSNTPVGVDAG